MVETAAPGGMYIGAFVSASPNVGSCGGITTPLPCLVSLEAMGRGGNSRSVSFNTAFTVIAQNESLFSRWGSVTYCTSTF